METGFSLKADTTNRLLLTNREEMELVVRKPAGGTIAGVLVGWHGQGARFTPVERARSSLGNSESFGQRACRV